MRRINVQLAICSQIVLVIAIWVMFALVMLITAMGSVLALALTISTLIFGAIGYAIAEGLIPFIKSIKSSLK